jgi:hypothetical protein
MTRGWNVGSRGNALSRFSRAGCSPFSTIGQILSHSTVSSDLKCLNLEQRLPSAA